MTGWRGGEKGGLRLLLSAAARLVCVPENRKRSTEHVIRLRFRRSLLPDRVGGGERGVDVSLASGTALLVCMPADPDGECAG